MANIHRNRNLLSTLSVSGKTVERGKGLEDEVCQYFQKLFTEEELERPWLNNLNLAKISAEKNKCLESRFSEEEIWPAVKECRGDKAPGSDGFTLEFYQKCWSTVKEDLLKCFDAFVEEDCFVKGLNSTLITLIRKTSTANDIADFRPINLVSSFYKILAKVLANRLKQVLGELIRPEQHAFVEGRQITDVALIANEVVDFCWKKKKEVIICKIDMEKAFDRVSWQFILATNGVNGSVIASLPHHTQSC